MTRRISFVSDHAGRFDVVSCEKAIPMRLTKRQVHVLENLDRVEHWQYQVRTPSQTPRYQLDGQDCTPQITALVIKDHVAKRLDGTLHRVRASLSSASPF